MIPSPWWLENRAKGALSRSSSNARYDRHRHRSLVSIYYFRLSNSLRCHLRSSGKR